MFTEDELSGFYGTENYYRYNNFYYLTDGTFFLSNNGAGWLIDAIASYHNQVIENPRLKEFQLWELTVKDNSAILTCREDSGCKPFITQKIEFTDFPLQKFSLYVCPYDKNVFVILLKSEY